MARLDIFSYLACCAWNCRGRTDARAAAHIHACIDGHDVDIGAGLLHQGRTTLVTSRHPSIRSNDGDAASWRFPWLVLGLTAASMAIAGGFDTPEDAVRALEEAYVQQNEEGAVAAIDFVEEGRQMLQKINPTLANDVEIIKQAAEDLERSFRNELRTKGFPDFAKLKCSFVGKAQISPGLVKLTEQCVFPDGGKWVQELIVTKRDLGWRVTLPPPP